MSIAIQAFQIGIFVVILLILMYCVYRQGVSEGTHKERMHLLAVLQRIPLDEGTTGSTRYHVLYITNYICNALRKEWDHGSN